jgi:hypothetical protein
VSAESDAGTAGDRKRRRRRRRRRGGTKVESALDTVFN